MKYKFFALIAAFAFLLNNAGAVVAQTKPGSQTNGLAALLPASDGVITLDVQRLLSEAVPQILSAKPQVLDKINAKIDEFRDKTGLDARQFEQVVIGISTKQIGTQEIDLEPVILARGKYKANALIALAKIASNGKYREEKIGSRTIYVFSIKEIAPPGKTPAPNKPSAKSSPFDRTIDRLIENLTKEIAVTSYDENTLAFGSLARVRATLEGKLRVSGELLSLVNRKPDSVMSFGAMLPNGLSSFFSLDNDEFGRTLDSIRQMSGAIEISNDNAAVSLTAKTLKAEQAQSLHETLEGLQMIGKSLIGSGEDKKVYARMIENAKFTRNASEVTLDLQVPQSDINILLAGVK